MIRYKQGNILEADTDALVNTVNTVGIMGKGIALMFKEAYPSNFDQYKKACKDGAVRVGQMFVTETGNLVGPRFIINFPTKQHWRSPSSLEWIEEGLEDLVEVIRSRGITSIAIPPLGAGNGGLDWPIVRERMVSSLERLQDTDVVVYEPTAKYQNVTKRTVSPKLTTARALVLEMVRRYSALDMGCTILEVQKLGWFLERSINRLGLEDPLDLKFEANRYGPYSDRLRHLLDGLDGSYLSASKRLADAGPLDIISYDPDRAEEAWRYLMFGEAQRFAQAVELAGRIVEGFESPLGLEALATVDWILANGMSSTATVDGVDAALDRWPGGRDAVERKRRILDSRLVRLALHRLAETIPEKSRISLELPPVRPSNRLVPIHTIDDAIENGRR